MLPLDLSQPSVGYRLRQAPGPAMAVVDGEELPLDRLSPEDACALAARRRRFFIGDEVKVLFLGRGLSTPLVHASVAKVHDAEGEGPARLDFGFRGTDLATARKFASFVETLRREGAVRAASTRAFSRELVSDRDRICHVAEILARNRTRALVRLPGDRSATLLRLIAVDRTVGTLTWDSGNLTIEESLQAELIGHSSIFMLDRLPVLASAPGRVITPLPPRLLRTRRRAVGRVRAAPGELTVRFRHPVWRELVAARMVRDFSFRGVSFWCDAVEDLVYPGLLMDEVEVSGEGLSKPVSFRADVRMVAASYLTTEPNGSGHAVGMSLAPRSRGDRQRWARLVGDRLYPATRATGDGGQELWEVYERSGYFALSGKEPQVFAQRRREFQSAGKKLAKAPELGSRVLWSSQRGVECTVSVNKVYRYSWLGHQMARRPADSLPRLDPAPQPAPPSSPQSAKEALRETFLRAFETAHADPDIRWFVGFIEGRVRWMRAANIEFAQQHLAEDQAVALPFRLREGIPSINAPVGGPGAIVSGPMDGDQNLILGALTQIRSRAYREAFDLVPARLDMGEISRRWEKAGMVRSRALRVARHNGKPVAASILERGEPGINLFHLLNAVRLVVLPAGEVLEVEEREAALAELLVDAQRWYAEAGVDGFVYLQEMEVGTHADVAGLKDLGMGYVWALSARLLPEWMEHVYELTSPRAPEPD